MELPYDLKITLLGIYPKEFKGRSQRGIFISMFVAVLFTTANRWKQPECLSMDKWTKKMWSIHQMEYYAVFKKKKILLHVSTWRNLKGKQNKPVTKEQIPYASIHMKYLK